MNAKKALAEALDVGGCSCGRARLVQLKLAAGWLRQRSDRKPAHAGRVPRNRGALSARGTLPQSHPHGEARLRKGRVQILQVSAAESDLGGEDRAISAPGDGRQCVERANEHGAALSGESPRIPRSLPSCWT